MCYSRLANLYNDTLSKKQPPGPDPRIWIVDDIICVNSPDIDKALADEFEAAVINAWPTITRMVVSNPGGDVRSAIRMARVIREHRLSIFPWGLCLSSCANYLFMAAEWKYFGMFFNSQGVVGFRGKPPDEGPGRLIYDMHRELYEEIGVTDAMTDLLPCNLWRDALFHAVQKEFGRGAIYWVYSPEELERGFGVKGLVYDKDFKYPNVPGTWRFGSYEGLPIQTGFLGVASCPNGAPPPPPGF